jgi:galactokinase/mevalonate kinase-like predicted kinase
MTSGGGWQDQVGGILPGVKLIRTQPGLVQTPTLHWTVFGSNSSASAALQRRMLLYYTGQKRLAQNILQNVVVGYLAREPEVLRVIDRLKQGAERAKQALEANDVAAFMECITDYWELKKAIDPGSTNPAIEAILDRIRPYTAAHLVCGAGGGGFLLLVAHNEAAAHQARNILESNPPNAHARFFDFAIDNQGLSVTVL